MKVTLMLVCCLALMVCNLEAGKGKVKSRIKVRHHRHVAAVGVCGAGVSCGAGGCAR